MTAKKNNEAQSTGITTIGNETLPSFLQKSAPVEVSGTEDMSEDFATPRIQLAQAMSPQVKKKNEAYIEGLGEGEFFHAVTKRNLGDSFKAVILKIYDSRTLFDEDDSVDCYSSDTIHGSKHEEFCKDCPLKDWGSDKEPPACKVFQNHIIVTEDGEAAIISIRKSNKSAVAEAKNLKTQAKMCERGGHGLYAYVFEFKSKVARNGAGNEFAVISASPAGFVDSEERYNELKEMAEQFADFNKMNTNKGDEDGGK